MLLGTALEDFSSDNSRTITAQPGAIAFEWEASPGNPKSSNSEPNSAPAVPEIKYAYGLGLKLPPSRQASGELKMHSRQSFEQMDSPRLSPFHSPYRRSDQSRSPPPLLSASSTPKHRSLMAGADENLLEDNMSFTGDEVAVPFVWEVEPGKSKSPPSTMRVNLSPNYASSTPKHRALNSGADENILHDNMSFTGEALAVPFTWEAQPGKAKLQDTTIQDVQLQLPPARKIILERDVSASPSPRSLRFYDRAMPPARTPKIESKKAEVSAANAQFKGATHSAKFSLGDVIQIKKLESSKNPRSYGRSDSCRSIDSDSKYYQESSPVSTLQRLPSPSGHSSGSSVSAVQSPRNESVAIRGSPASVAGPEAEAGLPSFCSSSAPSSPRCSTSSSTRYMSHCLLALQAALAVDPEKPTGFEDSFVEVDTYIDENVDQNFAQSPSKVESRGQTNGSPVWTGVQSELELGENVDHQLKLSSSNTLQACGNSELGSTTSSPCRPIRCSINTPRKSIDEYTVRDKRFLSDHPSSWIEDGDNSSCSSAIESKCSTLNGHQEVSWDEQQADHGSQRPEELVKGAVDGLRFTYSPVSSAFVFSRASGGEEADLKIRSNSPHHHSAETDISRRFSICLDYGTSVCSEGSHSFARTSNVTELSRAESWSKVVRGIAFQQAQYDYHDAVPSSFIKRPGFVPLYEENVDGQMPESKAHGFVDCTDSQIIRERSPKKTGMTTCLPLRYILRNFKTIGSPERSRVAQSYDKFGKKP